MTSSRYAHEETRNFDRAVSLITTVPVAYENDEQTYFAAICPQIRKLFLLRSHSLQHIRKAALMTGIRLLQDKPQIGKRYILDPIVAPLLTFMNLHRWTQQQRQSTTPQGHRVVRPDEQSKPLIRELEKRTQETQRGERDVILVEEDKLVQCVENLHMLLTDTGPAYQILHVISDIIPALFQLYCFVSRTKLFIRSSCEEIITSYFRFSDDALDVIKSLVKFERHGNIGNDQYFVVFAAGGSGGVCIKAVPESTRDSKWEAQCVINLLKLMRNDDVAGNLFVHLCSQFAALKQEIRDANILTEEDETVSSHSTLLLQTILLMIENLGSVIMKNTLQALSLVKFMLLNEMDDLLQQHDQEQDQQQRQRPPEHELADSFESISMVLSILEAILRGAIPIRTIEEEHRIEELLPILRRLHHHPNHQISEVAHANCLLIESKSYRTVNDSDSDSDSSENEEAATKAKIASIMEDLKSPVVPVRSYGLDCLRELVLSRSAIIEKHMVQVLDIFKSQLKDEDSFAYYAAIRGLSAMGDIYPDRAIPLLCDAYMDLHVQYEHRLKVGESLLDVAERCGHMLPKYAHHLVHTFLAQCRAQPVDPEDENDKNAVSFMKASSLSNLATVTELLKFAIQPFMQDIVHCATVLSTDPDKDVRRAVLFLLLRIVKGLGKDMFDVMSDQVRHIVQLLKKIEFYDTDGLIRHNAAMIVDQIGDVLHDVLTPEWYDLFHGVEHSRV